MKKVIFTVAIALTLIMSACKSETKKAEGSEETTTEATTTQELAMATFGVRGNCKMCKATIEKAANGVEGVEKADWSVDHKMIEVSYNSEATNVDAIKAAIAASGYDTEGVAGNAEAYSNLPTCCQYDHEMEMNQDGSKSEGAHE